MRMPGALPTSVLAFSTFRGWSTLPLRRRPPGSSTNSACASKSRSMDARLDGGRLSPTLTSATPPPPPRLLLLIHIEELQDALAVANRRPAELFVSASGFEKDADAAAVHVAAAELANLDDVEQVNVRLTGLC